MDPTPASGPQAPLTPRALEGAPRRRSLRWIFLGAGLVVAVALIALTDIPPGTVIAAVLAGMVIMRVGWFFLQQFATPPPPPPDPGTLRKVRLVYRCSVCGTEVRMTSAASEDPEPPRHCMEEMELIASDDD